VDEAPPLHVLLWHVRPPDVQSVHETPAVPQAVSTVPGWHVFVESQQPLAHDVMSHAAPAPLLLPLPLPLPLELPLLPLELPLLFPQV
jgi:hypothetical protein